MFEEVAENEQKAKSLKGSGCLNDRFKKERIARQEKCQDYILRQVGKHRRESIPQNPRSWFGSRCPSASSVVLATNDHAIYRANCLAFQANFAAPLLSGHRAPMERVKILSVPPPSDTGPTQSEPIGQLCAENPAPDNRTCELFRLGSLIKFGALCSYSYAHSSPLWGFPRSRKGNGVGDKCIGKKIFSRQNAKAYITARDLE